MTDDSTYTQPNTKRDVHDLSMLAKGMMRLERCPGGRYNVRGHICMHCGVDYTNDEPNFCGQPVGDDHFTPFDTTVARRIMRKSEEQYEEGA